MATEFKKEEKPPTEPLPVEKLESKTNKDDDEHRIWIGNMDLQMNEFTLLQLLKMFKGLKGFEVLVHRAGPQQGQSKGFGFATYRSKKEAQAAITGLNNRFVMRRRLLVRWANEQSFNEKPAPAVLTTSLEKEKPQSKHSESAIEAIERKLQEMEEDKEKEEVKSRFGLHPLLQQARVKKEQEDARKKRLHHPYRRRNNNHHRR